MSYEYGAPGNFVSPVHAYTTAALVAELILAGIKAQPRYDDEGNYTPVVLIELPDQDGKAIPITVAVQVLPLSEPPKEHEEATDH